MASDARIKIKEALGLNLGAHQMGSLFTQMHGDKIVTFLITNLTNPHDLNRDHTLTSNSLLIWLVNLTTVANSI